MADSSPSMETSRCQIYDNSNQVFKDGLTDVKQPSVSATPTSLPVKVLTKQMRSGTEDAMYKDETTDSEVAFQTPRGSLASEPETEPDAAGSPVQRHSHEERPLQPCAGAAEAPQPALSQPSPTAWAPRRRGGGEHEVEREIRSILNKLTVEKFQQLSQKLVQCGIATREHLTLLISEILEKAMSQHHFIEMYADLCAFLDGFYSEKPVGGSFRSLLRSQCHASFDRLLRPPEGLELLAKDEMQAAEAKYKQRMVGNIRFVGALLTRSLLPGKVLPALLDLLLEAPTAAAIEAATALLTVAGPAIDVPDSKHRAALDGAFERARNLAACGRCGPRARCLLLDLLELRMRAWRARPAGARAAPEKLREVARRAEEEQAAHGPRSRRDCRPCLPSGPARDRFAQPSPSAASASPWLMAKAAKPLVKKVPLAKSMPSPFTFQ